MLGVASGLECLHLAEFIHFNLHSRNILVPEVCILKLYLCLMVVYIVPSDYLTTYFYSFLFQNFNAKLGGLSLVKHYSGGEGSHGTTRHCIPMAYEDPEYKRTGMLLTQASMVCFQKKIEHL